MNGNLIWEITPRFGGLLLLMDLTFIGSVIKEVLPALGIQFNLHCAQRPQSFEKEKEIIMGSSGNIPGS